MLNDGRPIIAIEMDSRTSDTSRSQTGTDEIISFLTSKWEKEKSYRLRKELFCVGGDYNEKIAVQFFYEYQDSHDSMRWKRCYGLEDWTFDVSSLLQSLS